MDITLIIIGILLAISAASLGNILVLKRISMLTDAISHGILPGIIAAYFLSHGKSILLAAFFSALSALVTVGVTHLLHSQFKIQKDAAIGIIFPVMFSIGILLLSQYRGAHVDAECVLYGEIQFAALEMLFWGNTSLGPKAFYTLGIMSIINLLFLFFLRKELKFSAFDPLQFSAVGFSSLTINLLFFALLSTTAVSAFTFVGAILFISFVVVPPATARLITNKFEHMIFWSLGLGSLGAVLGIFLGTWGDVTPSATMAVMNGVIFAVVAIGKYFGKVQKIYRLPEK